MDYTQTESELNKVTIGFTISATIAIILNTILTITKEMYSPLLAFMKSISILGVKHHWLVHGLTIIVLFYLFGWSLSMRKSRMSGKSVVQTITWTTILGSLSIVGFFLFELYK